jgi:lipoic acid synthetase
MLGMGETAAEIRQMLADLGACGVRILTIGQYLAPSAAHWPVARYVTPEEFTEWGNVARAECGFAYVVSQPLVRSSYLAEEACNAARPALT